jgi:sulfite exporter TauE/SafE
MADISLLALFLIGFLGGSHCVGMCGGLSSAFALQLPPNMRRWQLILCLNTGRLLSYVFIGVALGALSQYGISLDQTRSLQTGLLISRQCVAHLTRPVFGRLDGLDYPS